MTDRTKYNTSSKSDNNQHSGNQEMPGVGNSDLSEEIETLEDVMQKMNDISSKPEAKGTLIPSHCQKVKKYCKLLVTYLSDFSTHKCDDKDKEKDKDKNKSNNSYKDIKSKISGISKHTIYATRLLVSSHQIHRYGMSYKKDCMTCPRKYKSFISL